MPPKAKQQANSAHAAAISELNRCQVALGHARSAVSYLEGQEQLLTARCQDYVSPVVHDSQSLAIWVSSQAAAVGQDAHLHEQAREQNHEASAQLAGEGEEQLSQAHWASGEAFHGSEYVFFNSKGPAEHEVSAREHESAAEKHAEAGSSQMAEFHRQMAALHFGMAGQRP